MIGMEDIKKNIIYLILLHTQKLDIKNKDLLHTVIQGPPGVGKTKVAEIIADIYKEMGILQRPVEIYLEHCKRYAGSYLQAITISI